MDQDRRTLGEDAAIGQLQGRDLLERVELLQGVGILGGLLDVDEAVRDLAEFQRGLDGSADSGLAGKFLFSALHPNGFPTGSTCSSRIGCAANDSLTERIS
jgi:hypothetical protein